MGILDAVVLAAASGPNNVSGRAAHGNCDDLRRDWPFAGKRPYVILGHCLLNGTIGPRVTLPDGPTIFIGVRMTFAARFLFLMLCLALPSSAVAQSKPKPAAALPVEIAPSVGYKADQAIFSNNGREIISAADRVVNLWDAETGRLIRTFTGHADEVIRLSASDDGAKIVSAGDDKKIVIWDAVTGRTTRTLIHQVLNKAEAARGLSISRDGTKILSAGTLNVKFWDANSGNTLKTIQPTDGRIGTTFAFNEIAMSPDGKWGVGMGSFYYFFEGKEKHAFLLMDLSAAKPTWRELNNIAANVDSIMLSEAGHLVTGRDRTVSIWSIPNGQLVRSFEAPAGEELKSLAISANGKVVAARSKDRAHVWDVDTGKLLSTIEHGGYTISLSPDGDRVLLGLELYFTRTGMKVREAPKSPRGDRVAYAPDGEKILTSGRVWDARSGHLVSGSQTDDYLMAASTTSDAVAMVSRGKEEFRTYNALSGEQLQVFSFPSKHSVEMKFSRDGRTVAVAGGHSKSGVLFDVATGYLLKTFSHGQYVRSVDISPDGKKLITLGDDEKFMLWDANSGSIIRAIKPSQKEIVWSVAFSPDSSKAAIAVGKNVEIWDVSSGRMLRQQRGHSNEVDQIIYSPDGQTILSASRDATFKLWNAATGNLIRTIAGGEGGIFARAQFSPDGKRIVSNSRYDGYRVWNAETGALLARIVDSQDGEWLVITPEGFFAASEKGASILSAVRGRELISIEQVYQSLYRPDLVREKLAGDPRGLVREAATRLDLTRVVNSGSAPSVRMVSPAGGTADGQLVNAEAELIDRGGGIGRVEWRVNGVTVGVDTPSPPAASQPLRLTRTLALDPGSNIIEVVAYNAANLVASLPARTTVTAPAAAPAPGQPVAAQPSRLFVIAAGIDDYTDSRFKLAGSVRDARTLSQAFTTSGAGLYQSVNVKLLTDADVNKDRLDAAFKEFAAQATPADVFVLHLAGHGKTVDGRYYFVPRDFKVGNNSDEKAVNAAVVAQGIAQEQWQRWFASIPARKSMILFDTCESGSLTGDAAQTKALEQSAANDRLAQATGRSIITASSSTQLAFEYRGHGLFTYNLLDAMERADSDGNGTIEINELAAYVYAQVTRLSEQVFKKRQEPQIRIASSYPLTKQGRVLAGDLPTVAEDNAPAFQLAQTANLQIKPGPGATVVRSLNAQTAVTVLKSEGGWSLVASGGKPLGYVATRDLAPAAKAASR